LTVRRFRPATPNASSRWSRSRRSSPPRSRWRTWVRESFTARWAPIRLGGIQFGAGAGTAQRQADVADGQRRGDDGSELGVGHRAEDRWRQILQIQSDFAGHSISVSEQITASERATNFHNRAIAWLLLTGGYMYCDPMEACDVYTLQCSTLVTAVDLAVMGATLANGGINPVTAKRVIAPANVSHVLAEMTMEGLYTSSGDWAYTVGLPAKSGVGGGLVAVSPGKLAIAAYSPPLDQAGNSVRAQAAVTQIAHTLELGLFNT
jgi:glutaminase